MWYGFDPDPVFGFERFGRVERYVRVTPKVPWLPIIPDIWLPPLLEPLPLPLSPEPLPYPKWRPRDEWLPDSDSRGYDDPRGRVEPEPERDPDPLPRRPRKDVHERKVKAPLSVWRAIAGKLLSNYSEAGDFVEALFDALPDGVKPKNPTMPEMLQTLYEHYQEIDVAKAIENWVTNNRGDSIWGQGFGVLTDALEAYGLELPTLRL